MSLVEIGTKVEAVQAAKDAVLEILNARADQETIRVALRAFVDSIQPKNNTFSGCSFISETAQQSVERTGEESDEN
jgi:hypothetical protein